MTGPKRCREGRKSKDYVFSSIFIFTLVTPGLVVVVIVVVLNMAVKLGRTERKTKNNLE